MKFNALDTVFIPGTPWAGDTIEVRAGWNLIGAGSEAVPVTSLTDDPPGIIASPLYGFLGSYAPADSLMPGRAYWVKSSGPGRILVVR